MALNLRMHGKHQYLPYTNGLIVHTDITLFLLTQKLFPKLAFYKYCYIIIIGADKNAFLMFYVFIGNQIIQMHASLLYIYMNIYQSNRKF